MSEPLPLALYALIPFGLAIAIYLFGRWRGRREQQRRDAGELQRGWPR